MAFVIITDQVNEENFDVDGKYITFIIVYF